MPYQEYEPKAGTQFVVSRPTIDDFDVPIALRKGVR